MCSHAILIEASKMKKSHYGYSFISVNLCIECAKFVISLVFYGWQSREWNFRSLLKDVNPRRNVLFAIPALLYMAMNGMVFLILKYVSPPDFQIMTTMKVFTTAILFVIIMRRPMNRLKWISLILLTIGVMMSQVKSTMDVSSLYIGDIGQFSLGIGLIIIHAWLSGLASVYTEYLMKSGCESIYIQNAQLYTYGILFNWILLLLAPYYRSGRSINQNMFHGFTTVTWIIILNASCNGLVVSWLLKYVDSVAKLHASSLSLVFSAILSAFLFDFAPSLQMYLGASTVIISIYLYGLNVELISD
jgi:solute carrier family 35 (UDP-sugar transporter), member A1/2/3